jgi:hypothetical protein
MNDVYEGEIAIGQEGFGVRVVRDARKLADNDFWSPLESDSAHDDRNCRRSLCAAATVERLLDALAKYFPRTPS